MLGGRPITARDIYGLASREDDIEGKTFIIDGGDSIQRWSIWSDVSYVLSTTRGRQMLTELKKRTSWFFWDIPFKIHLDIPVGQPQAYVPSLGANTMYVNPNFHPWTQTTWGWRKSETFRIIGHEFGHAVFGDGDVDYMGQPQMRNVILNENPIAVEAGYPKRTAY